MNATPEIFRRSRCAMCISAGESVRVQQGSKISGNWKGIDLLAGIRATQSTGFRIDLSGSLPQVDLATIFSMAEHIEDKLDPAGHSQFLENSVDVVPDGVFLDFKLLGDFAILQPVGDEMNHFLFAPRQKRHSFGVVNLKLLCLGQRADQVFEIFVAGPDLSFVDHTNTFGKGFQGVGSIENSPRSTAKGGDHAFGLGVLQKHDGRGAVGVL